MPSWVRSSHTRGRSLPSSSLPSGRVSEPTVDASHWPYFDWSLDPGLYRFEIIVNNADFLNYFTLGLIDNPNQPEPIYPSKRFGEAYGIVANLIIPPGEGWSRSGGNFPQGFGLNRLDFRINSVDEYLRIEAWVKHPSRRNHEPLPPGFGHFPQLWVRQKRRGLAASAGIALTPTLETTFRATIRAVEENETLVFSTEDGEDSDFNDLIARLSRVGG